MSESNEARARVTREESAVGETRAIVLSGEIRKVGTLCDIISFLAQASWWGELVVDDDAAERSLFFDEGHVVAARSTAREERLGAVLRRCGVLTEEQTELCAERAADRGIRFGEALVDLGFISREKLFTLMGRQVADIFGGLARITTARFAFYEGFDDADLSFRQKHGVAALLLDAIRQVDEAAVAPESEGVSELDVTRALFQLIQSEAPSDVPVPLGPRKTIDVYNEALTVLFRELDDVSQGNAVRVELRTFASDSDSDMFFAGAALASDGRIDAEATAANVSAASDPEAAEKRLSRWLYDYASYALFLARPHLGRRDDASRTPNRRLSGPVAQMLDPLAPPGERTLSPPSEKAGSSTLRLKKVPFPGVDPSRTARLQRFTETNGTARLPRYQLPSSRVHRAVTIPSEPARRVELVHARRIQADSRPAPMQSGAVPAASAGAPSRSPATPRAPMIAVGVLGVLLGLLAAFAFAYLRAR